MPRFKYFFAQAKKNIIRNGLMSVASLFTIVCCLFILGLFIILSLNVSSVTEQIKDQCEIQVFLDADTPPERVEAILGEIKAIDNVKEANLYTKAQMLEDVKATMFEDRADLMEGFGDDDNPFSDSYKIVLNDISKAGETTSALEKIENVEKVTNKQDIVNIVISVSRGVKRASIAVMALLFAVAVVIISNTVRLTVFNRRKEINIMKYIGATDRFIRIPFLFEGVMIGFLGALISLALMCGAYWLVMGYISSSGFELFSLVPMKPVAIWLAIVFAVVGCLIGAAGSAVSMKKYLRV